MMADVEPQPILTPPTPAAIFLVATVRPGEEHRVRDLLADAAGLARSIGSRHPEAGLACVIGIGSALYDRLFAGPRPSGLHPFRPIAGPRHTAVATPGDLLLHLRATRIDLCVEFADQFLRNAGDALTVVDEVQGFQYFDERDLLGFVDGTENPSGAAAVRAVLIGSEDPDFAGGSYVIVQKYRHDMEAWNALSTAEQERVIGRTKLDNIEMSDDDKPSDSHVALTVITDDEGNQLQIVRSNMPFASFATGERGTYFIGYAADPSVTEQMLRNMFIGKPFGNTDRVLDFSTAVTGSLFFVPGAEFLDNLPAPPGQAGSLVAAGAFAASAVGAPTRDVPEPAASTTGASASSANAPGAGSPTDGTTPANASGGNRTPAGGTLRIGSLKNRQGASTT